MSIATAARRPTPAAPQGIPSSVDSRKPAPRKAVPPAPEKPELLLKKKRGLTTWFQAAPKVDRSPEGFIRALRRAIDDLSEVNWVSPDQMCSGLEEHIRKALNAPAMSIHCEWAGTRRTTKATRLVVLTTWGLREDVEGMLSFSLFPPPGQG